MSKYALSSQVPSVKLGTDHTLTVDGVSVKIPEEVDLTPYAKSADVDKKIDHAIGSIPAVDLTGYVKKADLDDYARKSDIPVVPEIKLDVVKRTLTISGQELDIPASVDLSQYAKVDAVPKIALDAEKRTITVNGTSIDVPRSVDLSGYVTKAELTAEIGKVASGGKIDLTGYVTKADAEATYAKKSELEGMLTKTEADQDYAAKSDIKDVDLTPYAKTADIDKDFAKKTDVPSVVYDAEKKTLSVNGQAIELPENVDLSGYAKLSDIPKVDLTPYIKTSDADAKYAAKSDLTDYAKTTDVNSLFNTVTGTIPQISWDGASRMLEINGTGVVIPQSVDLTPYVKKSDADAEYAAKSSVPSVKYDTATKTLTVNGEAIKIPNSVDLSDYAKLSDIPTVDLTPYIKATDADAKYAAKADIPSIVYDKGKKTLTVNGQVIDLNSTGSTADLSQYLTKNDADTEFAKKDDVPTDAITFGPSGAYNVTLQAWDNPYTNRTINLVYYNSDANTLTVGGQTLKLVTTDSITSVWMTKTDINNSGTTTGPNGEVAYSISVDDLEYRDGKTAANYNDVHVGDVVITEHEGYVYNVLRVNGFYSSYPILLTKMGKINTDALTSPTDQYYSRSNVTGMAVVPKSQLKSKLGMDDTTKYTLDMDNAKLIDNARGTKSDIVPGIYQLRDHEIDNLTISSADNYGLGSTGASATPVQMTVTPYKIEVVLVSGTDVVTAWRSCWSFDNSSWFGVTDKWHVEK